MNTVYITMKKTGILLLFILPFVSCNYNEDVPDVTEVYVDVKVQRFDKDFFAIDSNNVLPGLDSMSEKYPQLTPIFLRNILGLENAVLLPGIKIVLYMILLKKYLKIQAGWNMNS